MKKKNSAGKYAKIGIYLLILAAIIALANNFASADIIHLKNGDKISGNVTLKDGMVTVKPPYTEKLLIGFKEIDRIDITQTKDTEELSTVKDDILQKACAEKIDETIYPNAGHLYLHKEDNYFYNADNTIDIHSRSIIKVLKERSLDAANFVRSVKKEEESIEIVHARSISPEGVVSNLRNDAVKYTDKYLAYPIYDKVKILQFSVPEVKIGSIIDVKMITKSYKADCLNPLTYRKYFISYEPAKYSKFTLTHPKNINNIEYKEYFKAAAGADAVKINREVTGETVLLSFEKNDIPDYIDEPLMPPFSYFAPNVKFVEKYKLNDIVAELKKRIEPGTVLSDKMKSDLAEIIKDCKNNKEKAKAIYFFLATNIKHVEVEASLDDYRPADIQKVYSEKYASLFDRTVLLYSFLKQAGISCDICFGTDQNSYKFDEEMISIYDFDNMLVECENDYLFASAEYYPYGIIPESYKDNKYFKIFKFNGKLFDITRDKFERSYSSDMLTLNITPDANTVFRLEELAHGSSDPSFRASYKNLKPIKRKQSFEQIASGIANGGKLINYTLSDVENHNEKQGCTIDFESPNYVSKLGDMYILVPLPLSSIYTGFVSKEDRKYDIFFDSFSLDSISVSIKLPDGYKVRYMPESIEKANEYFKISLKLKYDEKNNEVIYTRRNETLKKLVPVADFKKLKELFESAAVLKKERLILEKAAAAGSGALNNGGGGAAGKDTGNNSGAEGKK
jgi:hypothetical protein